MAGRIKQFFKDWNILVVDDEPDNLEVASRWLKLAGANTMTALNGQEGLAMARTSAPHLILADLTMPELDGWEMLYELKRTPSLQHIPVIALTAHVLKSVQDRVVQVGFAGYIAKPLNPLKFVDQVVEIIRQFPELTGLLASPHPSNGKDLS